MKAITQSLLFILLLSLTLSCSSDDNADNNQQSNGDPEINESDFFIKANIDGEERLLNFDNLSTVQMTTFQLNGFYNLILTASKLNEQGTGNLESISIDLSSDTPITEGVYNQPEDLPVGFNHARMGYQNINLSDEIGETLFATDVNNPVSSLEITELTEHTIKGKFSGLVQNPLVEDDISISDGEFFMELEIISEQ